MKLDRCFSKEVKTSLNGDGSRNDRISIYGELRAIADRLSEHHQIGNFESAIKEHGRAKVMACIAATINQDPHEYEPSQLEWARLVISLWTNRPISGIGSAAIAIHPAILMDRTYKLRAVTIEAAP